MSTQKTAILLYYLGGFILLCTLLNILLVGWAFSISIISGFIIAIFAGATGYFMSKLLGWAFWLGLFLATGLIFFYGWLVTINAYELIDMLIDGELHLKPYIPLYKQVNSVLLHLAMFIMSLIASIQQFVRAQSNGKELSS